MKENIGGELKGIIETARQLIERLKGTMRGGTAYCYWAMFLAMLISGFLG